MTLLPGVYTAKRKNGLVYYRSSITYRQKHISLGSFETMEQGHEAYKTASRILSDSTITIEAYKKEHCVLSFLKWVVLINFRDHGIYFKTPIYLKKNYFLYYLAQDEVLKFDVEDLFYYSKHKIMKRGGHLFVADYGMQVNIQSRYGIKNYAVLDRDYTFCNGDTKDYRYGNIHIINKYHGVRNLQTQNKNSTLLSNALNYETRIHLNGDYIVGRYRTEVEAAVAYNKAVMLLKKQNIQKEFPMNYIDEINEIEYASILNRVRISKKIRFLDISSNS